MNSLTLPHILTPLVPPVLNNKIRKNAILSERPCIQLTKSENVVHETCLDIVDIKPEYLILTPSTPFMNITGWLYSS